MDDGLQAAVSRSRKARRDHVLLRASVIESLRTLKELLLNAQALARRQRNFRPAVRTWKGRSGR